MSGISTGVGIFSGVDSRSLIDQLMALESRPRQAAQARISQLQLQQTAYLDINTRLSALRSAAQTFRLNTTFQARRAVSSNTSAMTATATNAAPPGTYSFLVDRLVSTQQQMSRGYANSDQAGIGLTSLTFESAQARLDRDVALADLNDGQGAQRGRITITDSGSRTSTIDLSRTTTIGEVLSAINSNGTSQVTASVSGGRLVVRDNAGGSLSIANVQGYTTATSLGIEGSGSGTITGSVIYRLNNNTTLATLNDGAGVSIKNIAGTSPSNFSIQVIDGSTMTTTVPIYLGEVRNDAGEITQAAASSVSEVVSRINTALAESVSDVTASIDSTNGRLVITDSSGIQSVSVIEGSSSTAADLGLTTTQVGNSIPGRRVLAGLNSTLARGLNGASGITGDGVLNFTARDGHAFSVTIDQTASLIDIFAQIETASGTGSNGRARISLGLDANGTGVRVTDNTGLSTSNLIITGTTGNDSATSLKISTGASGVAAAVKDSGNLQRRYMSRATSLSQLNAGRGLGTGTVRLTDATGAVATFSVGSNQRTLGDVIDQINSSGLLLIARINTNGDGIEVVENTSSSPAGPVKIKIEDVSGSVAQSLNLRGEAPGIGGGNTINGSFERSLSVSAGDTLQQIVTKINEGRAGVTASIVRDGNGSTPFRLSLTSAQTGAGGRFIVDSGSFDLAWNTLDIGRDSRAFYGSTDAARGIVLGGSTNAIDGAVPGIRLDLLATSETPTTITISSDTTAIETAIGAFVSTLNTAVDRINSNTRYDPATERGGPLLGDSTALELKQAIYAMLQSTPTGVSGRYQRLSEVGVRVGQGGRVEFNQDQFRQALAQDPAAVEALFTTRVLTDDTFIELEPGVRVRNPRSGSAFSSLGMMGRFEQLATRYIDTTDGVLTRRGKGLDDQIRLQTNRVTSINERLDRRRAQLERQFTSMELAIQKLQTQQSALGSLGGLIRR